MEIENDVTFFWDFGNGVMSIERDPVAIYNSTGNYTLSLIVSNTACKGLIIQKDISILGCLNNPQTNHNLAIIYPNPNEGEPNVFVKLMEKSPILLNIFDFNGRLVKTCLYEETQILNEKMELDNPGVCLLEIIHRNGIERIKTLVIK